MSTPTDSVAPVAPTGTSSPWSMPLWWKRIADWLAALSPAGATEYDTGWQPITPASGFTSVGAQVRRIGSVVWWRGALSGDFAGTLGQTVTTLPVAFRPSDYLRIPVASYSGTGAATYYLQINTAGVVTVGRMGSGSSNDIYVSGITYPVN